MARRVNRFELIDQSGRVLHFKGCPRCGGDMHRGRDIYGEFDTCMQCGHTRDVIYQGRIAVMLGAGGFAAREVA